MHIAGSVLMVRPAAFGFNPETAANNFFQHETGMAPADLHQLALTEFDEMVSALLQSGIHVIVIEDTVLPAKPDAVFPNNWFCANNGVLSVFPMFAENRRPEKRNEVLELISHNFIVEELKDWSWLEDQGIYLEGTGSMVMDHKNRINYACLSPRTYKSAAKLFADYIGYRLITFSARDLQDQLIYHTNVMMCIGEGFALLCADSIIDHTERAVVTQSLEATGHENIYITHEQMNLFAGNMLQLKNADGKNYIVLSQTALRSLYSEQIKKLEQYGTLLPLDVSTIERVEGGSVRCMMAEILLPSKE